MNHNFSECPSAFPERYIVSGDCNHVHPYHVYDECWRFRVQSNQAPDENGRIRTEVKDRRPGSTSLVPLSVAVPSSQVNYTFSFYIPGDWVKDPNKVALIHWHHTPADPALTAPPLSLFLWNNNLYLRLKTDAGFKDLVKVSFLPYKDNFLRCEVEAVWTSAQTGFLTWSLRPEGLQVVTEGEYSGPTCQAAVKNIYNSIGPYMPEPTAGMEHTVYFREWSIFS